MSEWDVLRCGLAEEVARVFVARAALWAVQHCGPGSAVAWAALWPGQHCGPGGTVSRFLVSSASWGEGGRENRRCGTGRGSDRRSAGAGLASLAAGEAFTAADQQVLTALRIDIIGRLSPVSSSSGDHGECHYTGRGSCFDVALTGEGGHDFLVLLGWFLDVLGRSSRRRHKQDRIGIIENQ